MAGPGSWRVGADRYTQYRTLFDWIGVRYLVLERSGGSLFPTEIQDYLKLADNSSGSYKIAYSDGAVIIIKSLNAKPRFEFSSNPKFFTSDFAIIRKLQSDPSIVSKSVLLEASAKDSFFTGLVASKTVSSRLAEIQVIEDNPNELQLNLTNFKGGILIVKDTYFQGWNAELDGRHVPILRVNGMVRGVEVASTGTHFVKLYYQPSSFRYGVVGDLGTLVVFLLVLATYRSNQGPRLETKIICCGIGCLLFILTVNWLVTRTNDEAIMLGTSEHGYALNLVDTNLKWRETDSTNGRELFTRGVRTSLLPTATDGHSDHPLHIGDLVYVANIGIAEVDMQGHFRPVGADDGATVAVCEVFAAPNSGVEKVALYRNGRWQLTVSPRSSKNSSCTKSIKAE